VIEGIDHRGDEMQEFEVQRWCPCLASQTWAAVSQGGRSGYEAAAPAPERPAIAAGRS